MPKNELSFETAIKELEKLIVKLESPDLTLSNALEQFEKGIGLMKTCDKHLKTAEGKLTELTKGKDGEFIESILRTPSGILDEEEE